jgi:multiple sugar transport system substrate-binding protein
MKTKKFFWILLAALIVLSMALTACGGGAEEPAAEEPAAEEPAAEEPAAEEEAAAEGPATITVWFHAGQGEERDALNETFENFDAEREDIVLDLVNLPAGSYEDQVRAASVAGDLPCLLDFDGPFVHNYVWAGYLLPLDEFFTEEEMSDFLPSLIEQGTYTDGKLYSVAQIESGLSMWGRKSLFEAAGVRIPTVEDPWDLEEFEAAMASFLELDGIEYAIDMKINYGAGEWMSYGFAPIMQSFGGDLIDRTDFSTAEGIINGPEAVEAMTTFQSWFTEKGFANPAPADDTCFTSGACALAWVGHWAYAPHTDAFGDDVFLVPMPDFGNGPKTGNGSWNWGLTTQCDNPELALDVLKEVVSPEAIERMTTANGAVPSRFSVLEQSELYAEGGLLNLYLQQIEAGWAVVRPVTPAYLTIRNAFSDMVLNIIQGADVQTELDKAADAIQQDLEENDFYK